MDRSQFVLRAEERFKSVGFRFAYKLLGIESKIKELFEKYDVDKSGSIDKMECYVMVLSLFLYCAQYVNISQKIVPSREYIFELFQLLDDGKGELKFKEFRLILIVCVADIVSRVIIQLSLSILVVPVVGTFLWEVLHTQIALNVLKISDASYVSFIQHLPLPKVLMDILVAPSLGILLVCVVVNMLLLPFLLDLYQSRVKKTMFKRD